MRTERRLHPRYPLAHAATLWLSDGPHPVQATNLSRGGVQLACDASTLDTLLNPTQWPVQCRLVLELDTSISLEARLVTHRRMAQDQYLLGWQFESFHDNAEEHLDTFILRLSRTAISAS